MEEIIAKKYAQALIKTYDNATLKKLTEVLCEACKAFEVEKFRDIIHSPYVSKAKKKDLLLSLLDNQKEFANFVCLLLLRFCKSICEACKISIRRFYMQIKT